MEQYGIGQPVRRKEDIRFITGEGRYTDDVAPEGMAYAHVLRSDRAHARILRIGTDAAATAPGVLAVLTGADAEADGLPSLPCQVQVPGAEGSTVADPGRPVLQTGKVRFVGDPVALIVAETPEQARDAADLVSVDYEDLPALTDCAAADRDGAPILHESVGSNLAVHWLSHDGTEVGAAFAEAARTVRIEIVNNRVVGNPMEPRVAIGGYDPDSGRYELVSPTQGVTRVRNGLADLVFGSARTRSVSFRRMSAAASACAASSSRRP